MHNQLAPNYDKGNKTFPVGPQRKVKIRASGPWILDCEEKAHTYEGPAAAVRRKYPLKNELGQLNILALLVTNTRILFIFMLIPY